MENFVLQADSIHSSLNQTVHSMVEMITPELPHTGFVTDLALIMIIGAIVTLAFFKIKQPLIIGYLFAGMLIGPLSPIWSWLLPNGGTSDMPLDHIGLLSDVSALNVFSEIGVILLMFVIGIEFPYARIRAIGQKAIWIGTLGLLITLGLVFYVATMLGLNFMDSLFIGAALSISSTAIIVKILEDMGRLQRESSLLVLGVLIVEDVIAVILISTLQSVALVGHVSLSSIIVIVLVAAGLLIGTFTIGIRIIPKLIDRVAAAEHREILLLSVLGLCFGYALFANLVGLSVAIGAFLAGVLVAESKSAEISKIISSPIKDMFVAIFFISVGALMDVSQLGGYIYLAIALIAVSIVAKFGGNLLGSFFFKQKSSKSLRSAFTLSSPRGEFSIVLVKTGVDIGAVSSFIFPLVGIITIVTAFITPFLIKAGDRVILKITEKENVR